MVRWNARLTAAAAALLIVIASLGGGFDFRGFHW
jgi:hypothetical protein